MKTAPKLGFEFKNITSTFKPNVDDTAPTLVKHKQEQTTWEIVHFFTSDETTKPVIPGSNDNSRAQRAPTAEVQVSLERTQLEAVYGGITGTPISVAETELGIVRTQIATFLGPLHTQMERVGHFPRNQRFMRSTSFPSLSEEGHQEVKWVITNISLDLSTHFTARLPLAALGAVADEDTNLKTTINLKPRTDFRIIFDFGAALMSESLAILLNWNLIEIVTELSGSKDLGSLFCGWDLSPLTGITSGSSVVSAPHEIRPPPPIPPVPVIKEAQEAQEAPAKTRSSNEVEAKPRPLSLQAWLSALIDGGLDKMAANSKTFQESHTEALGAKAERSIRNNKLLCPILECRGVDKFLPAKLTGNSQFIQTILQRLSYWHRRVLPRSVIATH